MSKLLALTGRSKAGKDFLADFLVKHHDYVRVSFSDELKRIANGLFPWIEPDYAPEDKEKVINDPRNVGEITPRTAWQTLDSLRIIDPLVFVHGVVSQIRRLQHKGKNIIVTDVRKEVEHQMVTKLNAHIIKIEGSTKTDYEDEDIIDTFTVHDTFHNVRNCGLKPWEDFLVDLKLIEPSLINTIPPLLRMQQILDEKFLANSPGEMEPWKRRIALISEFNEFLNEVKQMWCWWKPNEDPNDLRAREEFVDVVMFSMGVFLDNCKEENLNAIEILECAVVEYQYKILNMSHLERLNDLTMSIAQGGQFFYNSMVQTLLSMIHTGCELLDMSLTDFTKLYEEKFNLNLERIENDYCQTGDKTGREIIGWDPAISTKKSDESDMLDHDSSIIGRQYVSDIDRG